MNGKSVMQVRATHACPRSEAERVQSASHVARSGTDFTDSVPTAPSVLIRAVSLCGFAAGEDDREIRVPPASVGYSFGPH
jgi:hypothetical protein